jgi:spore coat protein CotH
MAMELNKQGEKSRNALPIYNMVKKIHPTVSKEEFMEGLTSKLANEVHSKIASIYVLFHLVDNMRNGKADLVVTDMVNYAGSKLDISSIYAKVYE